MFKSNDFQVNTVWLRYIGSFYGSEAKALIQTLTKRNVSVPISEQRHGLMAVQKPSKVMPKDSSQTMGQLGCSHRDVLGMQANLLMRFCTPTLPSL